MLEEIKQMWAQDCRIDPTRITDMVVDTPLLHSKYVDLLSTARLKYRKVESDLMRLRRAKIRYYKGEMTRDELGLWGWDQWQGAKPLKTDLEELLSTDEDILVKGDQLEYYKVAINHLEQIIRSVNSRSWDIRTIAETQRFLSGG